MYPMVKRAVHRIWEYNINFQYKKKLNNIIKNIKRPLPDTVIESEYKNKWTGLSKRASILYPRVFHAINGLGSIDYVPENIYYTEIEPVLNNRAFALAYSDKNFYEKYLSAFKQIFPTTYVRGINGALYDQNYNRLDNLDDLSCFSECNEFILKPSVETSGGSNVMLVSYRDNEFFIDGTAYTRKEFLKFLFTKYKFSFLLQEKLRQNGWFYEFNPTSVNTVRVFTYRSVADNNVHSLHAIIRFGQKGSIVDNQAAGGLSCGVNSEGLLNDFAIDKYGTKYKDLPVILKKAKEPVPGLEKIRTVAVQIANLYYYHRLLAFDFCYDHENSIKLLEINFKNIEINFLQMNNGPLLGQFTDEIIDYCRNNKKSLVFDFYV